MANQISKITMSNDFFKTTPKSDFGDNGINDQNIEKSLEEISVFNNKPSKTINHKANLLSD